MTMSQLLEKPTQHVLLRGISWDTYTRLCADCADSHAAHFAYDRGTLEIMVLSFEHESLSRLLAAFFEIVAEERDLDFENAGSTTFQREDLGRGFEADTAYYIEHAQQVRGKKQLILGEDPPPDLVIEVDVTHPSLPKLPLLAEMGVREVWRYDGTELTVWVLEADEFVKSTASKAVNNLLASDIQSWLEAGQGMRRNDWVKKVRMWAATERDGPAQ